MSGLTQPPSTVDVVGDLRNRIAELEQECRRLRELTGDAAICRASPSSDRDGPAAKEFRSLAILDGVPLPTCYVDANLRSLFANKAFRARFGASEDPARPKGLDALIGDALFERLRVPIDQALSGREVSVVVAAPSDKDGRCEMTSVPDRSSGNAVDGLLVTACGVSDDKRGQRALQKTQDLFERTEHAAGLGYLEWRADTGRCLSCSRGLKRLLGMDDEVRMTARRFLDAVYPEDRRLYREMTKRHHRAGKRYEIDYRIVRSDGTVIEVREVGEPIPGPNGSAGHWLACVQDISAQREKESELRRSDEKYRDLIVGLIEGIAIVRDQKILFANQALAEIFGFDAPEELVAIESTNALIAPHERARLKGYRDARRRGEPAPARYTAQYLRKDGTPLWLESSVRVVDWVGGPALQTTLIDITQRVEAERALKASKQRFKDFAEASSDWFWEMGPDLRFTWFSSEVLKTTGRHSRDLLGRTSWEIDPRWPNAEDARQHRADLEAHRPFKDYRYPVHLESGEVVHVSLSGIPVFAEDGGFQGYRGTAADITAQARAEQEATRAHALLADALESIDDGFLLYDRDDRLAMVNEYGRKRFPQISDLLEPGTRWEDLIWAMVNRGIVDVPEEQRDAWVREHRDVHRQGGVRYHQLTDGRWLELRDHRTRDGGCAVVGTNVTELKRAEAALKESEQHFRDFAEASCDWFWEMGPDLRFTRFSGQRGDIDTRRLVGSTWRALGQPDGTQKDTSSHPATLEAHKPFRDFRYHLADDGGSVVHLRVSGVPIFDTGGAFQGYRGTATDITAQVRAEQEAVRAREMLADAVESVIEGFAMFDRQDRLVLYNKGYRDRLAPIWDEIAPHPTWETIFRATVDGGLIKAPTEDLDAWIRQQINTHHQGGSRTRQLEYGDGTFVEIRTYPTRDGGFAAVGHDITALKRAEEALRQSEQRFKDFAESASDWFWEMGPDLRFTWFSNEYVDGIGKTRPENAKVPVDTPEWRAHLADLEAHRPFKDFRYMGHDDDGTEMYASVSGVPICDGDGTFQGYRGSATDITAQVRAEQEAVRAREMLEDAVESVTEGFAMFDRQDRLVLSNEAHRKLLAPMWDEIAPHPTWETMFRATVDRGLTKAPAEDLDAWIRQQNDVHHRRPSTRQLERCDGGFVEVRSYPTSDGGFAAVGRDITALKRAEEALRQSEQRFKDFAESASDWFWEMGPDLRFTWLSNGDVQAIGRTRAENAKVPADTPEWRAHLADLEAHRPFKDFRYLGLDFDGTEMYGSVSGVPVFDADGTFLGYRGSASNITAQVRAEQEAVRAREMLADAVESVTEGFAMYDRQDRLVLYNKGYRDRLTPIWDEIALSPTWETMFRIMVDRGLIKPPAAHLDAWLREQNDRHRKGPWIRQLETGEGRFFEVCSYPTRDGGFSTVRHDITALKRAEEALRKSEQRFKDFAEAASDWFWEMGPDLRFTWFSHEVPGNTGTSAAELIGQTRRILGGSDADQRHLADLEAHRPFKDFRYAVVDAHGREQYLCVSGVPVFGADDSFLGYRGTGKNVTAEVLAEQRAARAQAMLTDAVESIREGFAMFDQQDRMLLCNDNYRRALGPLWDDLGPDMEWATMFRSLVEHGFVKTPPGDREAWIQQQVAAHRSTDCMRQLEAADGRWIEIREYPTRDGGFATVKADITALKRAEQALRESEQRFKDFAEASSDWFWEMDPDLRFSWFSHQLLKGTRIRSDNVIGKTRRTLGRSESGAEKWRTHEATLKARRPFRDFRYRMRNEAGEDVYLSISGVPMLGPDGAFLGYRGTGKNITAQVLAEQRAAQAQATLHDAIESIAGGFALFDKHDRLVLCNESYRESLAEIADLIAPGVSWEALCRALMESGNLKIGAEDREAWMQEQISLHRRLGCTRCYETIDGRWLEVREYPTSDGGIAVIRADITALKQAETAVRESEALLKQAARMANLGHWVWDEQTDCCVYYSDEVARIYDLSAEELASYDRMEKVLADVHPEDRDRYQEVIADAKRNAEPYQVEYREVGSNGGYRYMRERGEPFFDEGGRHVRTLGILQDITEDKQIETALKESESLLKQAAQMADLGHWVWDEQADRCIHCSESLAQIYGMTTDQYMASLGTTDIVHIVHPEDREHYQEVIRQALELKTGYDVEFRERLADGSIRYMRERGEPVLNDAGQLVRTVGIAQDITKHKQIETALKESESLLKHAAQIADLGHWVWDEQVDRCIHCSEGLARMYGITPEEYIAQLGTHPLTMQTVLEEDKERYDEVIRRAIRLKKSYDIEFRERLADGSVRHMRERGEPVLDEAGQLVRTVGILQDITKHKRAEEAIRRARDELEMRVEERTAALRTANRALRREIVKHERTEEALRESRGLLEAIIEAAAMGINVKGPDLRYVFMNRYQASVYGVSPEQAVGKTPGELINPQYGEYITGLDRRVLETGETMPYFEEEVRDKDDVLRAWLTTKVPVKDNHDVLRYIVSASLDVSELKARERELKQAQKMDAVGKLTGGIAHDFNNLLFVVRGNVALLKDEVGDSGTARECLGAIHDAASLGADLTRSLLAFSRQQPLEPTVADLSEIVAHTVATLLRPLEKNIEIETAYPKDVWPVLIDRHRLENALLNLALNARDAMPDGGRLRISVENRRSSNDHTKRSYYLPPGEYVCLVIADSGVGMPPDLIERAFEPFFTTKPAGSGTGLGLSMVYGFIKQSGGYIDIESKLGQGTTITLHLPRAANVEEQQAAPSDEQRWIARGRETILVTEDDAAVRRVAVRILTKLGYQTREATDGAEALEILEHDPSIDLLFADIVLTGSLNGAQLAREAQARRPNLKVLFASGYSQPAVLRDTEGADAVPLLSKPYDADELGKLVRRVLDEAPETAPEAVRARPRRRKKR